MDFHSFSPFFTLATLAYLARLQYNLQTDMARRQLEYEAQQVQGAMTDKLGSTEQSSQRQEARLRRIRTIESEMIQLQRQQQMAQRVSCAWEGGWWVVGVFFGEEVVAGWE